MAGEINRTSISRRLFRKPLIVEQRKHSFSLPLDEDRETGEKVTRSYFPAFRVERGTYANVGKS